MDFKKECFQNLFKYERTEDDDNDFCYYNCKMLREFGFGKDDEIALRGEIFNTITIDKKFRWMDFYQENRKDFTIYVHLEPYHCN